MKQAEYHPREVPLAEDRERREIAAHLQHIEGNPLDADDIAMFEMFEREGWPQEQRIAYIRERALAPSLTPAAE